MHRLAPFALFAPGVALAAPDFRIDDMASYCISGVPTVIVAVSNHGTTAGDTYVDVFTDRASPPALGEWGDEYVYTELLYPGDQIFYTVALPDAPRRGTWVDVILDTDRRWTEANESDNTDYIWANFTGCR